MNSKLVNVLPQVLDEKKDDNVIVLTLFVSDELDYFKGHFPKAPILAGVVQLHWAIEYAREKLDLSDAEVKNVEVLKFKDVIVPNQTLVLSLTKKSDEKFLFSFQSDKGQHSSGRIVLESAS